MTSGDDLERNLARAAELDRRGRARAAPSSSRCPRCSRSCARKARPAESARAGRARRPGAALPVRAGRAPPDRARGRQLPRAHPGRRRASSTPRPCSGPTGEVLRALPQDPPVRRRPVRAPPCASRRASRRAASSRSPRRPPARSACPSATTCASPSCTGSSPSAARRCCSCRPRSRCRRGAITGRCCCAPARSRTSASWSRSAQYGEHNATRAFVRSLADRRSLGHRAVHRARRRGHRAGRARLRAAGRHPPPPARPAPPPPVAPSQAPRRRCRSRPRWGNPRSSCACPASRTRSS